VEEKANRNALFLHKSSRRVTEVEPPRTNISSTSKWLE